MFEVVLCVCSDTVCLKWYCVFEVVSGTVCLQWYYASISLSPKQAEQTKAPRAPALLGITILLTVALELFPLTVSEGSSHVSQSCRSWSIMSIMVNRALCFITCFITTLNLVFVSCLHWCFCIVSVSLSSSSCGSVSFGLALVFWLKEESQPFHCLQLDWFRTTNQAAHMVLLALLLRVTP